VFRVLEHLLVEALEDVAAFDPSRFPKNQKIGEVDVTFSIREDIPTLSFQLEILDYHMEIKIRVHSLVLI
jgi:hypothetical protein